MSYQYFDILQFLIFVSLSYYVGKTVINNLKSEIKEYNKKFKVAVAMLSLIVLQYFTPVVNFTEEGNRSIFNNTNREIRDKVTTKEQDFQDKQAEELNKLKKQSKEKRNEEIINN